MHDGAVLTAAELHREGVAAAAKGRHGQARRQLRLALGRCEEPELNARILLALAFQEAERGHVDEGLRLLTTAEVPGLPNGVRGLIAGQRALLMSRAGRETEALQSFDVTLALLDRDDPTELARAALNRGVVHYQRRALAQARADFEMAVSLAEQAGLDVTRAKAMNNLGCVDLLAGDLPSALDRIDEARPLLESASPALSAASRLDRARVLVAAGLLTEADADLAKAAEAFGSGNSRQDQAETELARAGLALARADTTAAERLARQAHRRFVRRGSDSWALRAELVRLGARAAAAKTPSRCHLAAVRLAAELTDRGLREEAREAILVAARALTAAGHPAEARRMLRGHPIPRTAPITTRLLSHSVRAEAAAAAGDRRAVFAAATHGLDELRRWQASFGGLDLQTGLSGHGRQLARQALDLAVQVGRPELVLSWVQRAHALVSRLPPVRPPDDQRARGLLEELRQVRAALAAREGRDPHLSRDRRRLEEAIRRHSWHNQGSGVVTDEVPLDRIQDGLAVVGGCLVTHLFSHDLVHALVVTPTEAWLQPLGDADDAADLVHRTRADLDAAAVTTAPLELAAVIRACLAASLAAMTELLWEPIAERTGSGPVLLVPAGALASVPWTLLPRLRGRAVTVARSLSSWAASRTGAAVERVGLVAGPMVTRAEEEMDLAAAAWPSVRHVGGESAGTSGVARLAEEVDLLHIAAHGNHDNENPLFSSLQLADGLWFGHDVAVLSRLPRHVLLSACELGLSTVRWGDETLGMTAAWLHSGASSVISAVARVNDSAACDVLAALHRELAAGNMPAVALARAMTTCGDDHPAPFVCFGAGW